MELEPGHQGLAYHFIPEKPNGELVVVHHGHACSLNDDPSEKDMGYGLQRTIKALVKGGYGVLGVFMPQMRPGDCTGGHEAIMRLATEGSPLRFFLEPTALGLNYLQQKSGSESIPKYRRFQMVGLSGGGWTTTVYAALDPRIACSVSIAGTLPLYLRFNGSVGDQEQFEPNFYRLAGYPDLYLLAANGKGRSHIQILNRRDDCCFGEAQHDPKASGLSYDEMVHLLQAEMKKAAVKIGKATFRLEIDETAPSHMISHHAIEKVLLPELKK
jgi:hypothetical protein